MYLSIHIGHKFGNLDAWAYSSDYSLNNIKITEVGAAATAVPEPEAYAMMLAGLGLIGFAARRKQAV